MATKRTPLDGRAPGPAPQLNGAEALTPSGHVGLEIDGSAVDDDPTVVPAAQRARLAAGAAEVGNTLQTY